MAIDTRITFSYCLTHVIREPSKMNSTAKTARTPGPWVVHPYVVKFGKFNLGLDIGPSGIAIATVIGQFEKPVVGRNATTNAAFIVTACNAHDELAAALAGLIAHRDELGLGDYPAVTRARAALAKVRPDA